MYRPFHIVLSCPFADILSDTSISPIENKDTLMYGAGFRRWCMEN